MNLYYDLNERKYNQLPKDEINLHELKQIIRYLKLSGCLNPRKGRGHNIDWVADFPHLGSLQF